MFDPKSLKLSDIRSPTTDGIHYIHNIINPSALYTHEKLLEWYEPDLETLERIQKYLGAQDEYLTIAVLAATWCPDSTQQVPRLIKIEQRMNSIRFSVRFLPEVLLDFAKNRSGEPFPWQIPPSPEEIRNPRFAFSRVPTMYFFARDGHCFGRVVEYQEHAETLEAEILYFIKNHLLAIPTSP